MSKKIVFGLLVATLVLTTLAQAQTVVVTKSAPASITIGDVLQVNITIKNQGSEKLELTVSETIGDAEAIEPQLVSPSATTGRLAAVPPYFKWSITLDAGAQQTLTYKIKPRSVGEYTFSQTAVRTSTGQTFYSDSLTTTVRAAPNGVCEPSKGENYLTSPEDCPSGSSDGICDQVKDGKCDPDCTGTADVDCLCGNGNCDVQYGESSKTCKQDCPSGGADNYCDTANESVSDGTCDPDCSESVDADCLAAATATSITQTSTAAPTRQPGFEAALAMTAMLAIAYLSIRKKRN